MKALEKLTIEQMDIMAAMDPPPEVFHVYPDFHAAVVKERQKKPAATDTDEYLNFTAHKGISVIIYEEEGDDEEKNGN